ncbi:dual specificity protein phosphatase family protein [Tumebacillus sp. ITR2]|uniref:Dual specificity protein phosphatase family protein n=1 Tax=Tumebacillus amylolyticus TaxID=2801339 RepID=A0ABS1JC60_9BACL|nr:dual specificity protein phosphatase family protein [Tumebacillus amylolyticus]MBL0387825.1 dual specificity protein phosphatase family protein [Tumebacillus amylolyticus]
MNYSEFIPGKLYAGSRPDEKGWQQLQNLHVDAIVNIREKTDHPPSQCPQMLMQHYKLADKGHTSVHELVPHVEQTVAWLAQGYTVYVHDIAGRNRLGYFMTALYMRLYCLPYQQALKKVRSIRPKLSPRRQFVAVLHEYERFLRIGP